jgi:superfamily II DNA or RNA helicase
MLALFGKPICRLPATELIGQGYLSNVSVKLVKNEEAVPVNKGAKWAEVYDLGVVHSRSRNEQIIAIAERHFRERKRVMVLIRKIEHGEILEAMLRERSIPVVFLSGRDSSETRESIKETYNDKVDTFVFVLIASTIFNEGVDMPEVNVIIVAAGGKSEVQTIQRVGRGLRPKNFSNELILYDFVDSGKFLGKHSRARIATYKKEGFLKEEGCGP